MIIKWMKSHQLIIRYSQRETCQALTHDSLILLKLSVWFISPLNAKCCISFLCRKHDIQNRICMLEGILRVIYSNHSHSPIRCWVSEMYRDGSRSQSRLISDPGLSPELWLSSQLTVNTNLPALWVNQLKKQVPYFFPTLLVYTW